MKSVFHRTVLIAAAILIFQGCGETPVEVQPRETAQSQKAATDLQSQLVRAEQELTALRRENKQLEAKVEALTEERSKEETGRDDKKIELLGAKAIAEFQVDQLNRRLDKLQADLNAKDNDLASIRQTAEQRESQVEELTRNIQQLKAEESKRTADLTSRLDKIGKELEQSSSESSELKRSLDERDQLLATLKNAVSDASKLKAQAESEENRLRAELAEAAKKLASAKTASDQDRQAISQLQAQEEEAREQVVKYSQAADECKLASDRLEQEVNKLRAEVSDLTSRVRAAQPTQKDQTSVIDRILDEPIAEVLPGVPSALR